jgi:hypothetical protein
MGSKSAAVPDPLSPEVVAGLKNPTSALAAAFVIGSCYPEILQFAARVVFGAQCHEDAAVGGVPDHLRDVGPARPLKPNGVGVGNGAKHAKTSRTKANGHRKSRVVDHRLAKRNSDDSALVEAMKAEPGGPIASWAKSIRKSRSSTITALKRLRDAGVASSDGSTWTLVEPEAPRPSRWVEPVSALGRREHARA